MELKATRYDINADGVATVWLHRPHRHNAWTGRMHAEYRWIFAQLEHDPRVRVAVVTGTGDTFCVGGDSEALVGHADRGAYDDGLPAEPATPGRGVDQRLEADFAWQWALRFPVIAAVNGACAGVGMAVACFADLRFAAAGAKFTTAAPKLGLPAEYGLSFTLPRIIGLTRAADLLLSGRVVRAEEAETMGLLNAVWPESTFTGEVSAYATHLATEVSPASISATKRQLYADVLSHDVGAALGEAARLLRDMARGPEYAEGVAALREKRPPRFA